MTSTKTKHTREAVRLAEILIPEGVDNRGRASRLLTSYGYKTREGIADLVDMETKLPALHKLATECVSLRKANRRLLEATA